MKDTILDLLKKNNDLPSLPEIIIKLEKLLSDSNSEISDIAKLIETEATLSGKIIHLSNTVYFGGTVIIKTIPMAIVRLGLKRIRDLSYSLNLIKLFLDVRIIDTRQYWIHNLAAASLSHSLAQLIGLLPEEKDLAYLGGLMHDIGIMVFTHLIPDEYTVFLEKLSEDDRTLEVQEREWFGIDHAELGALFIENYWHIDRNVVHAVRHHHSPFYGHRMQCHLSQTVNISNGICNNHGITNGIDCFTEIYKKGAWQGMISKFDNLDDIFKEVESSLHEAEALVSS